jgi:monothiol glutaredoxin
MMTETQQLAPAELSSLKKKIEEMVKSNKIVIFMKGTADFPQCGFSAQAIQVLRATTKNPLVTVNVLDDDSLWTALEDYTQWFTVPQVFINGEFVGGCDIVSELYERGELQKMLEKNA